MSNDVEVCGVGGLELPGLEPSILLHPWCHSKYLEGLQSESEGVWAFSKKSHGSIGI